MNNLTKIKQQKTALSIFFTIVIASIIGVSVWALRQQTVTAPHAAASTTISFIPPSGVINTGQQIASDIMVDPGNNQVSLVKLVLTYDSTLLEVASESSIVINQVAFPQTLAQPTNSCSGTLCTITATVSIGQSPTNAIQTKTKLATFNAKVLAQNQATITVNFDTTTAAYSLATTDQANENVLSSTVPLSFVIGNTPTPTTAGVCSMDVATCAWDAATEGSSYHYKITDITTGNITIKEGDITAPQASVDFPQKQGDTYTCVVTASSACGSIGQKATTTNTCSSNPSITPTFTTAPTVTPTITIAPTLTVTPTMTMTPTPTISMTPIPTVTPIVQVACNYTCSSNENCQAGLSCVAGACRNPSCTTSTSCSCPVAPQPTQPVLAVQPPQQYVATTLPTAIPKQQAPRMLPTGPGDSIIKLGIGGVVLALLGGLLIFGL